MKKLAALIISLFLSASLFSLDFDSVKILDDSEFPLTRTIEWKNSDEPELTLLPEISGTAQIRQHFLETRPEITVEKLYRIPLETEGTLNTQDLFLKLANIFGNPETQTKSLYRSYLLKKEVPLIEKAFICNERGVKLSPLHFSLSDIPGTYNYFQYVDETNFAKVIMNISMNVTEEYYYISLTNTESLKYWIFPVIAKEHLFVENLFFVDNNALYLYSATQLKKDTTIKKIGPYNVNTARMIGNRMNIITGWVEGELAAQ